MRLYKHRHTVQVHGNSDKKKKKKKKKERTKGGDRGSGPAREMFYSIELMHQRFYRTQNGGCSDSWKTNGNDVFRFRYIFAILPLTNRPICSRNLFPCVCNIHGIFLLKVKFERNGETFVNK